MSASNHPPDITIRTDLQPGDIGSIVFLHGSVYAREYGFNQRFEAYVARSLAEFALKNSNRERLWIAERRGEIVGCVAIVDAGDSIAQLRWFLVDPGVRGIGLGKRLIELALTFCKEARYQTAVLWTVSALVDAARLYRAVGFRKVAQSDSNEWGVPVTEEKYELSLS
jgi:N-acetylglutamate synthase-like GNAT family acetyltransferase